MSDELRMKAYYYSFYKTGQIKIDKILSAIAIAVRFIITPNHGGMKAQMGETVL